jgi:hypothetical protein
MPTEDGNEFIVVLDTSVLYDDPRMLSARLRLLLEGARSIGARVVLPAVVVKELRRQGAERIASQLKTIDQSMARLARLVGWDMFPKPDPLKVEAVVNSVAHWYEADLQLPLSVAPHPTVSHEDLAQAAVTRRKPFKKDGQGYQDALIWHTVLALLMDAPAAQIAFITANTNDFFGGEKTSLHADLLADLDVRKGADRVHAFSSVDDFNRTYILPTLHADARIRFDVERADTAVGSAIREWLTTSGLKVDLLHLNGTAIEGELVDEKTDLLVGSPVIRSVGSVRARSAHDVGTSGLVLLELDISCRIDFTIELASRTYRYKNGSRGPWQTGELPLRVDSWREDVIISSTMVLNKESPEVVAADVTGLEGRHGAMEIEYEEEDEATESEEVD